MQRAPRAPTMCHLNECGVFVSACLQRVSGKKFSRLFRPRHCVQHRMRAVCGFPGRDEHLLDVRSCSQTISKRDDGRFAHILIHGGDPCCPVGCSGSFLPSKKWKLKLPLTRKVTMSRSPRIFRNMAICVLLKTDLVALPSRCSSQSMCHLQMQRVPCHLTLLLCGEVRCL